MKRWEIERAVLASQMPAPRVSIMLVLCTRINARAGNILPQHSPSLNQLARATGYCRRTIVRHVQALERDGWLHRDVPTREMQAMHITTAYTLTIPSGRPQHRAHPSDSRSPDPVTAGHGSGDSQAPERVTGDPAPGDSPAPKQTDTDRGQQPTEIVDSADDDPALRAELIKIALEEVEAGTGRMISIAQGAEAVRLVLAGRAPRNPRAYLRRAIREDPRRFAPATNVPPPMGEVRRQLAAIRERDKEEQQ